MPCRGFLLGVEALKRLKGLRGEENWSKGDPGRIPPLRGGRGMSLTNPLVWLLTHPLPLPLKNKRSGKNVEEVNLREKSFKNTSTPCISVIPMTIGTVVKNKERVPFQTPWGDPLTSNYIPE